MENRSNKVPRFSAGITPIVTPPEHALVLCVDEKSQIQALDRTAPGLPILPPRRPG